KPWPDRSLLHSCSRASADFAISVLACPVGDVALCHKGTDPRSEVVRSRRVSAARGQNSPLSFDFEHMGSPITYTHPNPPLTDLQDPRVRRFARTLNCVLIRDVFCAPLVWVLTVGD